MPTAFGFAVLPFALMWASNPSRLLQLALICGVFEGAAFAVIGGDQGLGLPPATAPALLFLGFIGMQYLLGMRYPGEPTVVWTLSPILLLLILALASAMTLPGVFANQIMIWPQKLEFFDQGAVSLRPDGSNSSQCIYLFLNVMITFFGSLFLTRGGIDYGAILRAYMLSGYVVILLAWWQLASRVAGVPYPSDFLYSNPGWLILTEQTMGSLPRINGPFSEPSSLATYLSGISFCCLWLCIRGHNMMAPRLLLALGILTIFLSTSTTGIVVTTVGLPMVLVFAVGQDRNGVRQAAQTLGALLAGAVLLIGPALLLRPELLDLVGTIIDGTLSKGGSDSFSERTTADLDGLAAGLETYGLGVGWGMFRTSSLIPGLLANGGLICLAIVIWFVVRIVSTTKRGIAKMPNHPGRVAIDGFSASLCGQTAAAIVAAPTITSMSFYLELACVVGAAARMVYDAKALAEIASQTRHRAFAFEGRSQAL